jgi:hypothetical protein
VFSKKGGGDLIYCHPFLFSALAWSIEWLVGFIKKKNLKKTIFLNFRFAIQKIGIILSIVTEKETVVQTHLQAKESYYNEF